MRSQSLKRTILLALFLTMMLFVSYAQAQDGSMTPTAISLELERGVCTTETLNVTTPSAPAPKLDVVFLFDITGSMGGQLINSAIASTNDVITNIRNLVPDARFAVGTFGDYGYPYGWQLEVGFTANNTQMQSALNRVQAGGGT